MDFSSTFVIPNRGRSYVADSACPLDTYSASIRQHDSKPYMLHDPQAQLAGLLDPGKFGENVARHIDGRRDFREIFSRVREEPGGRAATFDDQSLFADFYPLYEFLRNIDRLLLRHRSVEVPPMLPS